jgi:OmpA-OmpF porin, OOP family
METKSPCWPGFWFGLLALGLLALWTVLGSAASKRNLEDRLQGQVSAAIQSSGFASVDARMSGQRAYLSGVVPTQEAKDAAIKAAMASVGRGGFISGGVTHVNSDGLEIRGPVSPYVWSATNDGQTVTLSGSVPSKVTQESLLNRARSLFPKLKIEDKMRLDAGIPAGDWRGISLNALGSLAKLRSGQATLNDTVLTLSGDGTVAAVNEVNGIYGAGLSEPYSAKMELNVDGQTFVPEIAGIDLSGPKPAADDCQEAFKAITARNVINFETGRADIANDSLNTLDKLAVVASRCTSYKVEISGHTDNQGTATANNRLSERRAQAVLDYLASKGVRTAQMSARGFGPQRPIASNDTESGRAQNRRIEFTVQG